MIKYKINKNKLILTLILGMFLISFTSALTDNYLSYDEETETIIISNLFGLGADLEKATLLENICEDGRFCQAIKEIELYKEGILIEDFKTIRLDDNSNEEQNIRWYKFEYFGSIDDYETQCYNGETIYNEQNNTYYTEQICEQVKIGSHEDWIEFKEGDIFKEGKYLVKTSGEIRPGRVYDWQIKIQDKWTTPWAIWGNISLGDNAEVILNSPANNSIVYSNPVTLNASANVTGGATLVNATFYDNSTGSWGERNSSNQAYIAGDNLISYYKLDETTGTTLKDEKNLNNLTITGTPTLNQAGLINSSVLFVPSSYAQSGAVSGMSTLISATKTGTINLWWKATATTTDYQGIFKLQQDSNNAISLNAIKSNGQILYSVSTASYETIATEDLTDGNWKMITIVINNGVPMFYVNGVFKANATIGDAGALTNPTIILGNSGLYAHATNTEYTDELGIWNRTLTQAEITQLYNSGNGSRGLSSNTVTFTNTYPAGSNIKWNYQFCDTDGACGFAPQNFTFSVDGTAPTIALNYPTPLINYGRVNGTLQLNISATDVNLDKVWYNYNGTNITLTGATNSTYNISNITLSEKHNVTIYANDTVGNLNTTTFTWNYKVFEKSIDYDLSIYESTNTEIYENFTIYNYSLVNATLVYNNIEYTPSINYVDGIYTLYKSFTSAVVNDTQNVTFYFKFNGEPIINSTTYTQTIYNVDIDTNCSTGRFYVMNITNLDEDNFTLLNGTVTYLFNLLSNDNSNIITTINGSSNNQKIYLCSNINITNSFYKYDLTLSYNAANYTYKSYNIRNGLCSNLPYNLNLYYLNASKATEFLISYKDYNYYKHPGAVVQILRQYLDKNQELIIEAPLISNDGTLKTSFIATNIKYRINILENNSLIDSFDNIFPKCQNEILGNCEINLLGSSTVSSTTNNNLNYNIVYGNNTISFIFNTVDGAPKDISFITNQTSRFINEVSTCTNSIYASSGVLTCTYNDTVGESFVKILIQVNGVNLLQGKIMVNEDINTYFINNNYFIGFILLLVLALIFISSGTLMVISVVIGLIFLGYIYIIRANSINMGLVVSSISWLVIAAVLVIYKIAQKEERT